MSTGGFISGCRSNVLLLRGVICISDHEKFLQRKADDRDAHAAQINGNVVMNDGMAIACNLSPKRNENEEEK